jgi:gamma-glutamyltranspeptidase
MTGDRTGQIYFDDAPKPTPWTGNITALEMLNSLEFEVAKMRPGRRGQLVSLLEMVRRGLMTALAGGKE